MPKYDSNPDAEDIQKFAKVQEGTWAAQKSLDTAQLDFINNVKQMAIATTGNANDAPKTVRSGILGYVVRQDAALLTTNPEIHVNVPEDDPDQRKFANFTLEPWLQGAWKRSQEAGKVFTRLPFDLRAIGRAWSYVSPIPRLMVSDEYKSLVKKLQDESDPEEVKRLLKAIKEYKRGRFPIRWRYCDPRITWSVHDTDIRLPQGVELGEMTPAQIEASEWADKVPKNYIQEGSASPVKFAHYHNHFVSKLVLLGGSGAGGSNGDPLSIGDGFEHGLEMSPLVLMEADLAPPNDKGWRWVGAGYLALDTIEGFDQMLSDGVNLHHEWTYAPIIIEHDPNKEEAQTGDPKTAGRPIPFEYGPGAQVHTWTGEKIYRGEVPEMSDNSMQMLQEMKALIQQNQYSPVEQGQFKSGTSNNLGTTAVQVAEREFHPSVQAIEEAGENVCKLLMRSAGALNKDYPDAPDEVEVFCDYEGGKKKGWIGVPTEKLPIWEPAVQCIAARAIPQDGLIQTRIASEKVALGVSNRQVLEEDMGYANSQRVLDEGWDERMAKALEGQAQQAILALSGQMFASLTPQQAAETQELAARATPSVQQVVATPPAPGMPTDNGQSMANTGRTGSPQDPQEPTQQVIQ